MKTRTTRAVQIVYWGNPEPPPPPSPAPPTQTDTLPTLAETRTWFKSKVIPKRTASAGFSGNRIWKTPRSAFGNVEDANGLCGDAALFTAEEFFRSFNDYRTSDGHIIGMILWKGRFLNHVANVLLKSSLVDLETYSYNSSTRNVVSNLKKPQYNTSALFKLTVLDLYYKEVTDLKTWWEDQDNLGGTIQIGQQHDFT